MNVFALSDPHLSFGTPGKTMDRFGPQWVNHPAKIAARWCEIVRDDDLVLVTGDISWAMHLEGAQPDLDFLARLPGVKVLVKGNHDYWWSTISKVRRALGPRMHALQGDAVRIGDVLIAGTRLWDVPDATFAAIIDWQPDASGAISAERTVEDAAESARLWEREVGRLERALAALAPLGGGGGSGAGGRPLVIAATHYPPCGPDLADTAATRLMRAHGVRHAVFGHLHSLKRDLSPPPFGTREGITFHLAACDYLDFTPRLVQAL